ncbi:MAG: RNA-binding S4 domain-containing protein [Firmicutes bacterium]|nr:RNA-binding S4 domain-containing protein [Bacillota bacterium]
MRLDKYLKVSRIIKRRTVANEACDAGRVVVNGKPARASYDVKVGDIIEVTLGARSIKIRVLEVREYATKESADRLFEAVN